MTSRLRAALRTASTVAAVLLAFAAADARAGEPVTIAGDPCSVPLISELAAEYSRTTPGFSAEVSTHSCTRGVYMAADGEADIGVSTQNGLEDNLPRGAVVKVIARSPIVLIVNRNNPVDDLSYDELKGIFTGGITNWKEVGGPELDIENVMLQPCVKHTLGKQVVIYGDVRQIRPEGKVDPVTYTNTMVAENPAAIGQQIYGYHSPDVKVLTIDGVLPTADTLGGEYTFYQDYNVVTRGEPSGAVKGFVEFMEGRRAGEVMEGLGHVRFERREK